jgi:hypothetical protein
VKDYDVDLLNRVTAPYNPSNLPHEADGKEETYGPNDTSPPAPFWRSRKGAIIIGISVSLVLIGTVIGVAVGVSQKKTTSKSNSSIPSFSNSTMSVSGETTEASIFSSIFSQVSPEGNTALSTFSMITALPPGPSQ